VEVLIARLSDESWQERRRARQSLARAGGVAVERLAEVLEKGDDTARWEAAKALVRVRDPRAVPSLVRATQDANPGVRWLASEALTEVGRPSLVPLLQRLSEDSHSPWLQEATHHVCHALAHGDLRPVLEPVLAALEHQMGEPVTVVPAALAALQQLEGRGLSVR
jgi:HEAT repeat protein